MSPSGVATAINCVRAGLAGPSSAIARLTARPPAGPTSVATSVGIVRQRRTRAISDAAAPASSSGSRRRSSQRVTSALVCGRIAQNSTAADIATSNHTP